jgi:magnesium transporter
MTASPSTSAADALVQRFIARYPGDAARAFQDLDPADAAVTLAGSAPAAVAPLLSRLGPDASARVVGLLPAPAQQSVLAALDPALATALLRRLQPQVDQAAFLRGLPAHQRRELESFLSYPENSAGSLMDPTAPVFRADARTATIAASLRDSGRHRDHVVMVVDGDGRLVGTLATLSILLADQTARLDSLEIESTPSVQAFSHRDEVADAIETQRLTAMPVVDINERPVGLLSHRALARVAEQEVAADMQSMVGVSREERALSSVGFAVRKRLPWLQINLGTAFLAAAVVGLFEDTIAQFTALAVLLPVVAGQSGNTGAQALAVTMRGLTLHEISMREWMRVVVKEASVGMLNGVAVAVVTMAGVYFWSGSAGLSLVIGVAMVLSMTIAGIAGAGVPLVLRALGQDPAQSSSIVLTTVTDVMGFLSFLGLASAFSGLL